MLPQVIQTAFIALGRNVTRTLLTMLGIIIGIAAVITMMEIGNGASRQISASISNMGSNMLLIFPRALSTAGVSVGSGTGITLTSSDCDAIVRECPSVRAATPVVRGTSVQAIHGSFNWSPGRVDSGSEAYFDVNEWSFEDGEGFSARDVSAAETVCVVGETIVENLFEKGESAVGARIRLNNVPFTIVGVLSPKGANLMGMDQNDLIVVPWTTMRNRLSRGGGLAKTSSGASSYKRGDLYSLSSVSLYPERDSTQTSNYLMPIRFYNVNSIMCSAVSPERISTAIEEITDLLRARHRIQEGGESDFEIRDMSELLSILTSTSTLMTSLLLIVALISLIVGGVGIMNIMLVSVTERTREIGLRMAVGARGRDILTQFLVESLLLCLVGGFIGVAFGRGVSMLISHVKHWPVSPSWEAILLSVAVSAAIGIGFGFYPAWRASRLNPIDALHYE